MTRAALALRKDLDLYAEFWDIVRENATEEEPPVTGNFVVVNNTPGYLPEEDEPATFSDLSSAVEYLREEVVRYCEHLVEVEESFKVYWSDDRDYAAVEHLDRSHDLGRVFEIVEAEGEADEED